MARDPSGGRAGAEALDDGTAAARNGYARRWLPLAAAATMAAAMGVAITAG